MERMLGRSRPFYKAGPVMRLQKIPADRFADFIEARFRATRHPAGSRASARRSSSSPATCPTTSSASRTRCGTMCGRRAADRRASTTCTRRSSGCSASTRRSSKATWQRLTLAQRAALRAAVLEDGRELLSADVRARHRLERHVDGAGVARRARARGRPRARRRRATSSSIRCFANGSRGRRSERDAPCSERLGPRTGRELRAWAMYDWANSAFQTTIIAAVFPIYFAQRSPRPAWRRRVATQRFAWATTIAHRDRRGPGAAARRDRRLRARSRSGCSASSWRSASSADGGDVLHRPRRLAARAGPVHPRQHRRRRQHRLLRVAAAAHRRRGGARPRLDGRLRDRLPRRRRSCSRSTCCGS